jgi:hypothetical protein
MTAGLIRDLRSSRTGNHGKPMTAGRHGKQDRAGTEPVRLTRTGLSSW